MNDIINVLTVNKQYKMNAIGCCICFEIVL